MPKLEHSPLYHSAKVQELMDDLDPESSIYETLKLEYFGGIVLQAAWVNMVIWLRDFNGKKQSLVKELYQMHIDAARDGLILIAH